MSALKSEKDFLVETLVGAGVSRSVARKAEILSWAKDNPKDNERVHAATNSLLLDLLQKDELGKCVHVTGGARALTDPFHRQVCEAMLMDDKNPFQVLYHVPADVGSQDWDVVAWNLSTWQKKGFSDWRQKIRTLRMIGNRAVDLKAYDERNNIQFSVFGHRYIQVQSQHDDEAAAKYIWLIRSEEVNELLAEEAETDLKKATNVNEDIFADIVSSIFSNSARAMLNAVTKRAATTIDDLLEHSLIRKIDPEPASTLEALKTISFLKNTYAEKLELTDDGADFLKSS